MQRWGNPDGGEFHYSPFGGFVGENVEKNISRSGTRRTALGISQSIANKGFLMCWHWENGKTVPFKLTRRQFETFCERMKEQEKLA